MTPNGKAWSLIKDECQKEFVKKWGENNMMFPEKEFSRALDSATTVWGLIEIIQRFRLTKTNSIGDCQTFVFKVIEKA